VFDVRRQEHPEELNPPKTAALNASIVGTISVSAEHH